MKAAETLVATHTAGALTPALSANRVLRNTYWLLSLTLLASAGTAATAAALQLPHPGILITLLGYFGLLF
jgi:modulator of FtsH protease